MLLVVSLDSESRTWIEALVAGGEMPNLAHLMKRGVTLPVDAAVLPGIAYPTFYSGASTADLGMYFPVQWSAAEQRSKPWNHYGAGSTIFERMDAAGARTVVLDAPESAPVRLKNGFAASGLQFRARVLKLITPGRRAMRMSSRSERSG